MKKYKETEYYVTEDGKIFRNGKEKKSFISKQGYRQIQLSIGSKIKNLLVHRIIAEVYLSKIDGKDFINHKNGIKSDNRIGNLEWTNRSENMTHSVKVLGKKFKGFITDSQKNWIVENYIPRHKQFGQSAIAKKFNITQAAVRYHLNNI